MNAIFENGKVILSQEDFVELLQGKINDLVVNPITFVTPNSDNPCNSDSNKRTLEKEVTVYLLNKGITRNLSGFNYARKMILMALEQPETADKITVLYHLVAKEFNSTGPKIERSIRHAIESTGNKVINSQFICDAVDEIKLMGGDIG